MVTVDTLDPRTGERVVVAVIDRKGKKHYQRLKRSIYDPSALTPRELAARAAFAEAASTARGKRAANGELPGWGVVRLRVPEALANCSLERESKRQENRKILRSMVPESTQGLAEFLAGFRVRTKLTAPVTESSEAKRAAPASGLLPIPPPPAAHGAAPPADDGNRGTSVQPSKTPSVSADHRNLPRSGLRVLPGPGLCIEVSHDGDLGNPSVVASKRVPPPDGPTTPRKSDTEHL